MVYEYRNIMTFVDIFAHIDILRRKRRGIQPEVIKKSPAKLYLLVKNKEPMLKKDIGFLTH